MAEVQKTRLEPGEKDTNVKNKYRMLAIIEHIYLLVLSEGFNLVPIEI